MSTFLATMGFSSREETPDTNTPSNLSSHISITGNVQYFRSSISNSSVHTTSTATTSTQEDLFDPGPDRDSDPPIPDRKSSYSLEKQTFAFRNQSLSTVYTTREPESDGSSIEPSTPKQELCSLNLPSPSLDNEVALSSLPSTPRSSAYSPVTDPSPIASSNYVVTPSIPLDDLLTKPYGDSQPSTTKEMSKADRAPILPASFLPPPTDRQGTTSRSRSGAATVKGKKGVLGFMTDFLSSNKRPEMPEITTPHDLVHLTHVDFDPSTGEFIGLPQEWKQALQECGISKSDQERNRLAVMEIVKLYQEGDDDIQDNVGFAREQGRFRRPPIPGAVHAAYRDSEASASINVSTLESPNSSNTDVGLRSQVSKVYNSPVVELRDHQLPAPPQQQIAAVTSSANIVGAIPRRREKKKEDRATGTDIVDHLQQICTDADPTRLYRNLVKIDQG